jgi:F1F0 ATPase subunit 2
MVNEILILVLSLMAGALLGVLFFGGLWWTVQKVVLSKRSALWVPVSLLLRTSIALVGFYFIANGHWERLLVCLLGFIISRLIVTLFIREGEKPTHMRQEASHAP